METVHDSQPLKRDRVLLILGALIYPIWYLVPRLTNTIVHDAFLERFLVGALFFATFILSFSSRFVVRHIGRFRFFCGLVMTTHAFYLLAVNHLHSGYVLGILIVVLCTAADLGSRVQIWIYLAYTLTLTWLTSGVTSGFDKPVYFFGYGTGLLVASAGAFGRLKSESVLRELSARNRRILESISDAFLSVDRRWKLTYFNGPAARFLGLSGVTVAEESLLRSLPILRDRELRRRIRLGRKTQTPVEFEYHSPRDGRWYEVHAYPSEAGLSVHFHDISNRKDADRRLIQTSKMAALGEMAAGIAHEINNPLAIIRAHNEFLQQMMSRGAADRAVFDRATHTISATTDRIAKIIRGLRIFSRDSGNDPYEPVSAQSLVADMLGLCGERIKYSQVQIETKVEEGLGLNCRPTEIVQVLVNFFSNSFDAVQKIPEKWIRIDVRSAGRFAEFLVTDSGRQIAPEIAEKIFQPFFTTKEINQGTGLGLSISKGLVEAHGGSIVLVQNSPNTQFRILIPRPESWVDPKGRQSRGGLTQNQEASSQISLGLVTRSR